MSGLAHDTQGVVFMSSDEGSGELTGESRDDQSLFLVCSNVFSCPINIFGRSLHRSLKNTHHEK